MDVDPITDSEEVARLCYESLIGSDFEEKHGWHVNLMPEVVLREFPSDWEVRAATKLYGALTVVVPGRPISSSPSANATNRGTAHTTLGRSELAC
jgi:hypothetical protein